jgi:short-subunit dehydrogenase
MKNDVKSYALITGASAGLGRALASELAGRGHNLVLVSLPDTGLNEQGLRLEKDHGVIAHCLEADMAQHGAHLAIREFTSLKGITVNILINNVGIGYGGEIGSYSDEAISEMIFLNLSCATFLTNIYIDELKLLPESFILNIGSFSGFLPLPYKSIYAASKAYIYHFSMSVGEELNKTGVSVSVAMPGPVKTNHKVRTRISVSGKGARISALEADEAAKEIIRQMFRKKRVIIPGRSYRFLRAVEIIIPYGIIMKMVRNMFKGIN